MKFCLYTFLDKLPQRARESVLYGVVGSLNARLIGAAQRIAQFAARKDVDIESLINNQFATYAEDAAARAELGTGHNMWHELLWIAALRDDLRDQLALLVNDDSVLPLSDTLAFMAGGTVRVRPQVEYDNLAAALGNIKGLDSKALEAMARMDAARSKAELAAQASEVLTIVMALPRPGDVGFVYDQDNVDFFSKLTEDTQRSIVEKLEMSVTNARDNAVRAFMQRRRNATLTDIPLLTAAMEEVSHALDERGISDKEVQAIADAGADERREKARLNQAIAAGEKLSANDKLLAKSLGISVPRKLQRVKTGEVATA